jgi:MFS family permease
MRLLAVGTGVCYLVSAILAWSVHVRAESVESVEPETGEPPTRIGVLLITNVVFAFVLNVPEVALPLILVTQFGASPVWVAVILIINTVMVFALQVPVTVWMSRFSRRSALAISGVVIAASYLAFLVAVPFHGVWAALIIVAVSVPCTVGEIVYAGSGWALVTAISPPNVLGRALARFQLSVGFSLAVGPVVITTLVAHGPAALWVSLAVATVLSSAAISR